MPVLETTSHNGVPRPTAALLVAFMATTVTGSRSDPEHPDPTEYRQILNDAKAIADSMDFAGLREIFFDISDRAKAMECRTFFGSGDTRNAGTFIRLYPDCEGSGLK
jgi:hypothetical protein